MAVHFKLKKKKHTENELLLTSSMSEKRLISFYMPVTEFIKNVSLLILKIHCFNYEQKNL